MGSVQCTSDVFTTSDIDPVTMSPSPLAVKRRREAERPPVILPPTKTQTKNKEKKKSSGDSKILDYVYFLVGFIWYSIVSLWKKPSEYQLEARINVTKALYTPSEFIVKIQRTVQNFGTNPPQKLQIRRELSVERLEMLTNRRSMRIWRLRSRPRAKMEDPKDISWQPG